jgi:hypothetical protein
VRGGRAIEVEAERRLRAVRGLGEPANLASGSMNRRISQALATRRPRDGAMSPRCARGTRRRRAWHVPRWLVGLIRRNDRIDALAEVDPSRFRLAARLPRSKSLTRIASNSSSRRRLRRVTSVIDKEPKLDGWEDRSQGHLAEGDVPIKASRPHKALIS